MNLQPDVKSPGCYLKRSRPVTAKLQLLAEIAVDSGEAAEFKNKTKSKTNLKNQSLIPRGHIRKVWVHGLL